MDLGFYFISELVECIFVKIDQQRELNHYSEKLPTLVRLLFRSNLSKNKILCQFLSCQRCFGRPAELVKDVLVGA